MQSGWRKSAGRGRVTVLGVIQKAGGLHPLGILAFALAIDGNGVGLQQLAGLLHNQVQNLFQGPRCIQHCQHIPQPFGHSPTPLNLLGAHYHPAFQLLGVAAQRLDSFDPDADVGDKTHGQPFAIHLHIAQPYFHRKFCAILAQRGQVHPDPH